MVDFGGDYDSSSSSSSSNGSNSTRFKDSRTAKGLRAGGSSLSAAGQQMISDARDEAASNIHAVSYRKGGKVRKTGRANLHKGERVIPKGKVKRVEKMMRKSKMRMKAGRS